MNSGTAGTENGDGQNSKGHFDSQSRCVRYVLYKSFGKIPLLGKKLSGI